MADLDNPLDQIPVGTAQPAVIANENFDALSPAAVFGRHARTCAGLVWGYYGGRYFGNTIAAGTITVTANATTYVVVHKTTGVLSHSTSNTNWNDTGVYDRLYLLTSNSTDIYDWDDYRQVIASSFDSEFFQDLIAAFLTAGSGITLNYNDPANTLEISASGGSSDEAIQDIVGALLVAGDHIQIIYSDDDSPPTLSITNTRPGHSQEELEDFISTFIQPGNGMSIQYNDGDSPATLVFTATGADPEFIQDVVGALVQPGYGISVDYDDASSPATLTINNTEPGMRQEVVEDLIANFLTAGPNITLQYNDGDSPATLQISSTASGGGGASAFFISESDPAGSPSPSDGARWLKLSTGIEYTWVTGTWVQLD